MQMDTRIPFMVRQLKMPDLFKMQEEADELERQRLQEGRAQARFEQEQKDNKRRNRIAEIELKQAEEDLRFREALGEAESRYANTDPSDAQYVLPYGQTREGMYRELKERGFGRQVGELEKAEARDRAAAQRLDRQEAREIERLREEQRRADAAERAAKKPVISKQFDSATGEVMITEYNPATSQTTTRVERFTGAVRPARGRAGAGAGRTAGGTGTETTESSGGLPGLSRDRQGNITLSKDTQRNFERSRPAAEDAANALPYLQKIEEVLATGEVPESRVGGAVTSAGAAVLPGGMQTPMMRNQQLLESQASALIGLLKDPRLKGNPVLAEAAAVREIIYDPRLTIEEKRFRVQTLIARVKADIEDHNNAFDQYDDSTKKRLEASGFGPVEPSRASPRSLTNPAPQTAPPAETPRRGTVSMNQIREFAREQRISVEEAIKRANSEGYIVE